MKNLDVDPPPSPRFNEKSSGRFYKNNPARRAGEKNSPALKIGKKNSHLSLPAPPPLKIKWLFSNSMDHMGISDIESSSVILSRKCNVKDSNVMPEYNVMPEKLDPDLHSSFLEKLLDQNYLVRLNTRSDLHACQMIIEKC